MTNQRLKQKIYKRAHNMLTNNIKKNLRAFYQATKKYSLSKKSYKKRG